MKRILGRIATHRSSRVLSLAAGVVVLFILACNVPPVIEQITISRNPIGQNDTTTLTATVSSNSGVSYHWYVVNGGGTLDQPNNNPVVFTAPKLVGICTLALRVVDAQTLASDDTVTITVQ